MVTLDESRVERIRFRLDSKMPVWWKRSQYVGKTSSPPRWHSLEKFWREGSGYLWVAKCGYMWKDRAPSGGVRSSDTRSRPRKYAARNAAKQRMEQVSERDRRYGRRP